MDPLVIRCPIHFSSCLGPNTWGWSLAFLFVGGGWLAIGRRATPNVLDDSKHRQIWMASPRRPGRPRSRRHRAPSDGLHGRLRRSRAALAEPASGREAIWQSRLDDLEEILIGADVGVHIDGDCREPSGQGVEGLSTGTQSLLANQCDSESVRLSRLPAPDDGPLVLVVGVNGSGKTTTIGGWRLGTPERASR